MAAWFVDTHSLGVTRDCWNNTTTNSEYIVTTIHYITNDWKIKLQTIANTETNESKTGVVIREHEFGVLDEHSCNRSGNTKATDNAANMKAAFCNSS